MAARPRTRRGFTIVEMLVVIGITTLLLGLLLPALNGARKRARKTEELNYLRQIGLAWTMYGNNNKDACLPGYLTDTESSSDGVQDRWKVKYKFPDKSRVPQDDAASWPWRLMTYLEFNHDIMLGYRDAAQPNPIAMTYQDPPGITLDPAYIEAPTSRFIDRYGAVPYGSSSVRPYTIARTPAFGYNAHYVGGWWEMVTVGASTLPRPRFWDARSLQDPEQSEAVVTRSIGNIRRSTELVLFGSCALRDQGVFKLKSEPDDLPGWHWICPPTLADRIMWDFASGGMQPGPDAGGGSGHGRSFGISSGGDPNMMSVYGAGHVFEAEAGDGVSAPLGRFTGQASLLYADNHVDVQTPMELQDARFWIDVADRADFRHTAGP